MSHERHTLTLSKPAKDSFQLFFKTLSKLGHPIHNKKE